MESFYAEQAGAYSAAVLREFPGAESLIEQTGQQRGQKCVHTYAYEFSDGSLFAIVARFEGGDREKTFCQYQPGPNNSWHVGLREDRDERGQLRRQRPLFGLRGLLLSSPRIAFVVEGEKAALAMRSLGLFSVTSLGGSNAPHLTDWSPLSGLTVLILPDNDDAGRAYAQKVASILHELDMSTDVRIVTMPALPLHGDAFDFIVRRNRELAESGEFDAERRKSTIAGDIERIGEDALRRPADTHVRPTPAAPKGPSLLPIPSFAPFPTEALPAPIAQFVETSAEAIGCDPAFVAMPELAVLAAAIGNSRRIRLKASWSEPSIVWAVPIAPPSACMKSVGWEQAIAPLMKIQEAQFLEHAVAHGTYRSNRQRHAIELATWKERVGKSAIATGVNAVDPPAEPVEPKAWRILISDVTTEAISLRLRDAPRGLLLARDELSGLIRSFGQYKSGRGDDVQKFLEWFSGRASIIDRKTGNESIFIPHASLSLCGTAQPGALSEALGRAMFENGFTARLLVASPPARKRIWTEATIPEDILLAVESTVSKLLALPMQDRAPIMVDLSPDGKRAWIEFYNLHGAEMETLGGDDLSAAWGKLEGYTARFALIGHEVRIASGEKPLGHLVDENDILNAVKLTRWFCRETERTYALLRETPEKAEIRQLVEVIRQHGGGMTVREVRRARKRWKESDAANKVLELVVTHGLGRWRDRDPGEEGGRPTREVRLAGDGTLSASQDEGDSDTSPAG